MIQLKEFVIENFRSIAKTEAVTVGQTCVIVGVNEAGKSNALLALCRTNPANPELSIRLKDDVPRVLYNEYEAAKFKKPYCRAIYSADQPLVAKLEGMLRYGKIRFSEIEVVSYFDGTQEHHLRGLETEPISDEELRGILNEQARNLPGLSSIPEGDSLQRIHVVAEVLRAIPEAEKTPEIKSSIQSLERVWGELQKWHGDALPDAAVAEIRTHLPKFIYFTKYGSLESFVQLERFIADRNRSRELPKQEAERNRAINALFKFTGIDPDDLRRKATAESTDRDLRQIKLSSGAAKLTNEFNEWWKQHETRYRFNFTLDGEYFRIWVEDNRNASPIELENRSAGLQWFLGFFVTFLVESDEAHRNAILLLDEPGVTLHPTAQRDLIEFFNNLGQKNQILYTTHSPFLIDHQNIDNVIAAYLTEKGETKITRDLGEAGKKTTKKNSVYPVHAALGLSVANTFLADAKPILVEGASDQLLLSGILAALRRRKLFADAEPIFVPFGGVNSLGPIVRLLAATGQRLLPVLLDADDAGLKMASDIKNGVYQNNKDLVILISKATSKPKAELEDLIPLEYFNEAVARFFEEKLEGLVYSPLTNEQTSFVAHVDAQLPADHAGLWKVETARIIKSKLKQTAVIDDKLAASWRTLLESCGIAFLAADVT